MMHTPVTFWTNTATIPLLSIVVPEFIWLILPIGIGLALFVVLSAQLFNTQTKQVQYTHQPVVFDKPMVLQNNNGSTHDKHYKHNTHINRVKLNNGSKLNRRVKQSNSHGRGYETEQVDRLFHLNVIGSDNISRTIPVSYTYNRKHNVLRYGACVFKSDDRYPHFTADIRNRSSATAMERNDKAPVILHNIFDNGTLSEFHENIVNYIVKNHFMVHNTQFRRFSKALSHLNVMEIDKIVRSVPCRTKSENLLSTIRHNNFGDKPSLQEVLNHVTSCNK